jgi:hypothetical protein
VVWSLLAVDVDEGAGLAGSPLMVLQPLAEALDALGEVAHHVRQLAAAAEQKQRDRAEGEDVDPAETTHETLSFARLAGLAL